MNDRSRKFQDRMVIIQGDFCIAQTLVWGNAHHANPTHVPQQHHFFSQHNNQHNNSKQEQQSEQEQNNPNNKPQLLEHRQQFTTTTNPNEKLATIKNATTTTLER